nr:GNAT family N-acetyltransferase [Oceanobacillus limi]
MQIKRIEKELVWEIRHQVMWPDKAFNYIKLAEDDLGIHFGLFTKGRLVSVVSLFIAEEECQFRKFATLQDEQGNGYGTTLLEFAIKEAKKHGIARIWCNARENKTDFYKKFGLQETNNRFEKGGKSYLIMEKRI